jgi:hypothetical protein
MSNSVLSINQWMTPSVKYMAPKINDKGGKSINIISTQTNRQLSIQTPLLMTWGIADFTDEKGDSDGKFSISLNFPMEEYATPSTNAFLAKIKEFENQFLDDAVKNSELWFGEAMSREVVKHMFFPILKYSKNKDTKKIDYSKPPSIRAKVQNYNGKWNVEIYDTKSRLIFPSDDPNLTPMDFVPKLSTVACVLGISQVWIGGKGMGVTLKLTQCIVKPKENVSSVGKCNIVLSHEDMDLLEANTVVDSDDEEVVVKISAPVVSIPVVVPVIIEPEVVIVPEVVVESVVIEPVVIEPAVIEPAVVVPAVIEPEEKELLVPVIEEPVAVIKKKILKKKST